ncbi:integral membrane protein [gamma proteobacterium HTCC5015]|nr:integral membrane protein [gamma proteobacterium HTCC5015]
MDFLSPFGMLLVGLLSSVHCLAMCGGIMSALSAQISQEQRKNKAKVLAYLLSYNIGRLSSYVLVGLLLGALGAALLPHWQFGHTAIRWLGATVMFGMGLNLAGWWPSFKKIESIGRPLWRYLGPVGRRLTPIQSPVAAYAYGVVWGWLPCGLVYAVAVYAASLAAPLDSALTMLAFGVGTLPGMLAVGWLFQPVLRLTRSPNFRRIGGVSICLLAILSLLFSPHGMHRLMSAFNPHSEMQLHPHEH